MRPLGERSFSVDFPTALAASRGNPSTFSVTGGNWANISTNRTAFSDKASTNAE